MENQLKQIHEAALKCTSVHCSESTGRLTKHKNFDTAATVV